MKRLVIVCWAATMLAHIAGASEPARAEIRGLKPTSIDAALSQPEGLFVFEAASGKSIPVWTYVPEDVDAALAPILIVMHGASRDADRYRDEWRGPAREHGFVVIAPEFGRRDFPSSRAYNLGNVFDKDSRFPNSSKRWSFSVIEPLFDTVLDALGSDQTSYTLYGHSAGSQFVHRFMYFVDAPRAHRYIAANAGWYTMPVADVDFPYGLAGARITTLQIAKALGKDVWILLGDDDTDTQHQSLRRTREAMRQGAHRFARGQAFYAAGKSAAETLGVPFRWRIGVIEGAEHRNDQMADGAARLVVASPR